MAINVRPLGDRVLVQPIEEQETKKGGIIIPDTAKEKPQEGKVVALGTGKVNEDGKKVEFTVKKGDKVKKDQVIAVIEPSDKPAAPGEKPAQPKEAAAPPQEKTPAPKP